MDRQQPFLSTIAEAILPGLSYLSSIALVAIPINYLLESCDISPASFFTAKVDIRVHDDMYNYLMAWAAKHDLSLQNHRLLASSSITNEQFEWSDGSDTEDGNSSDGMDIEFEETQEPGAINFLRVVRWTPAIGTHFFRYQNRLLAFTRSFEDRDTIPYSRRAEKLTIHCLGRNADILKMLIAEAQVLYLEAEKGKTAIYRAIRSRSEGDWVWTRSMSRASRPMTTIDIDPEVKDNFLSDLQSYLAPQRKRWYAVRGIPYRRGYLFYGPTGTGKSSLAFAAAGILGLKIYVLSLTSPKISDDGLASLFQTLPQNSMVLLEDIDAVGLTQNRGALEQKSEQPGHAYRRSQGRISLSALLNALDGIGAQEGRVLIMTSNHREHLDPALLRPGRIDHSIRFALANTDAIKAMFLRMFTTDDQLDDSDDGGEKRTDDSNNANSVNSLAELFARKVPADTFSPAEIQGFLLSHLADPRSAIIGVDDWLKVAQAASESGSPAALDVLNQDYPPSESDTCDSRGSSESEEEMS